MHIFHVLAHTGVLMQTDSYLLVTNVCVVCIVGVVVKTDQVTAFIAKWLSLIITYISLLSVVFFIIVNDFVLL